MLALAIEESGGNAEVIAELLKAPALAHRDLGTFGCVAREQAIRLLAWISYRPGDAQVDAMVADLMREQKEAHWGTTQGDAWSLLALTEYARRVEGNEMGASEAVLRCGDQSVSVQLDATNRVASHCFQMTNGTAEAKLTFVNTATNRLFTRVMIEARPPVARQPRQDRGFGLDRSYQRLDDENHVHDLAGLRVGDRVLVTLKLVAHEPAQYLVLDDALPSTFEAINPEFKTQETQGVAARDDSGLCDYKELRTDRALFFINDLEAGDYVLRYVARVRAVGQVTAPSAKVEEMYQPEHYGLSESQELKSEPAE